MRLGQLSCWVEAQRCRLGSELHLLFWAATAFQLTGVDVAVGEYHRLSFIEVCRKVSTRLMVGLRSGLVVKLTM